jgi:hypothetical protein
MALKHTIYDDVELIQQAQNGGKWQAFVNTIMNLRAELFGSQVGICSTELIRYKLK